MELPFSTVLILAGQKPKVFTFIARMTIIAPVVNPVFAFISDVKCEVLSCARNASPFRDFMIYGWCQNRNTSFDVRLLKQCSYFFMIVSYANPLGQMWRLNQDIFAFCSALFGCLYPVRASSGPPGPS